MSDIVIESSVRDFLVKSFQGFYQPRSALLPWAWHEAQKTELATEESIDYAGPYDSSLAPQNRIVMEFAAGRFSDNVEFLPDTPADTIWRECIVMKSSQVGVTLALLLVIVWWIAEVRKNVIYAIDTQTEAERINRSRLQPLIRGCPAAASRIQGGGEGMNNLTLYLVGMLVYMLGGAAEGSFQNKPASLAILDEADSHPPPVPGKPSNLDDLRSRLKSVSDAKIYCVSKPKTESHITHKEWKDGTRHVCRVPCPHCGSFQELLWENMRFDHCKDFGGEYELERVKRETFYECSTCRKPIEEKHKREMLLQHRWVQTNPRPVPGRLSIQESDLYSQFSTAAWGILACEYIAGLKNEAKMTTFRTDRLGKPARLKRNERKPEDVLACRCVTPRYRRGTLPVAPLLTAMGADVQGDVRKWVSGGFTRNGDLYVCNYGQTLAIDELLIDAATPIPIGMPWEYPKAREWDGDTRTIDQGIIDEGHLYEMVRRFCLRSDGLFVPSKGRGGIQVRQLVSESDAEIDGNSLIVYHFDDDAFKKQLYLARVADLPKILAGKKKGPRLYLPWDVEAEFVEELCSERLTTKMDSMGFEREKWAKDPGTPNDFGDALKQLLIIWYWLSPQLLADAEAADEAAKEQALQSWA